MLQEVLIGFAAVVLLAYVAEAAFAFFDDPREPRRVAASVPIIGHFVGFWWYGFDYYGILSRKTTNEVYALGVLYFKIYIAQSERLTNPIQKTRTLSVNPFLRNEAKVHAGISTEAHALFDGEVFEAFRVRTRKALAPGPALDDLSLRLGKATLREIEKVSKQDTIGLLQWTQHVVVQVTSTTMFGEQHPFLDLELVKSMWTWEDYRPAHHVGQDYLHVGYRARQKVFDTFRTYLKNMPDDVSPLTLERQAALREGGMGEQDIAQMQAFFSDAYYNIVPTVYWTIYNMFSRPELLAAVREELLSKAVQNGVLDISAVKTECHLLISVLQETQRLRHAQATARMVVDNTILDGKWLLKKGNHLMMPSQPIHRSTNLWGANANDFDPYRFVPADAGGNKSRILPSSFRPWGTAPYICPARQFVSTEILLIAAMLALRVDLTPVEGRGWEQNPALILLEKPTLSRPKKDVRVKVTLWEGGTDQEWDVTLGRSKARIALASG